MAGSCSSGFRSAPSAAAGKSLRKGLEVSRMNSKKPMLTSPSTPRTRALSTCGSVRLASATAAVQLLRISCQRTSEPSWAPQMAAKRYMAGSFRFECWATYRTLKSWRKKLTASIANASATNASIPRAQGRATSIQRTLPVCAPASGNTASATARHKASARLIWPISGTITSCAWYQRRQRREASGGWPRSSSISATSGGM